MDDWLRTDFSVAINQLEANDEWFAAQVTEHVLLKLKHTQECKNNEDKKVDQGNINKSGKLNLDDLSLVSKDDFEDWLTANIGIKFLESELSYELYEIIKIFSVLSGNNIDESECAVGPEVIFTALKTAIDKLEVPQVPQTLIYKTIARSLLVDLKMLYNTIILIVKKADIDYKQSFGKLNGNQTASNSSVIQNAYEGGTDNELDGFEPNSTTDQTMGLKEGVGNAQNVASANTLGENSSHIGNNTHSAKSAISEKVANLEAPPVSHQSPAQSGVKAQNTNESNRHIGTLNTLSRLNASVATGGKVHSNFERKFSSVGQSQDTTVDSTNLNSSNQSTNIYSPVELVSAISQLQQTQVDSNELDTKNLLSWIESGLVGLSGDKQVISHQESELIGVTDRFFEVIVGKVGLNSTLAKWLEKLKLTILKIVLRDEDFFSDVDHPARQVINKLALLATNDRAGHKRLEKVLDKFIDQVVSEFDDDDQIVQKVLDEINLLVERQTLAYQRNSDRIARAYEGKQKVADARYGVVQDLNGLLAGKSVPVVLLELIDKAGWRDHLSLVSVKDGHNSSSYKEALNVIDLLLHWLSGDEDDSDKWAVELEMELEAPSLIELITKELSIASSTGYESVVKRLNDCLFNNVDPLLVKVENYEWDYDQAEDLKNQRREISSNVKDGHWHKRIVTMKVGDWVELIDDSGRARCLRLAWSGSESYRFVFVDSQGMKDEDVTIDDLVEMFKQNRATFVDHEEVPLVDQGLHQMVQSVYEELSSQSSCDVLTGLLNRQAFERALEQSIAGAVINNTKAAMIYIDIDKFNLTNTTYGHHAGDALLKNIASIIKSQGLLDAFCGRLGGNEFGMILTNCSLETTFDVAKCIGKEIETIELKWEESVISTTASIGVAKFEIETDCAPRQVGRRPKVKILHLVRPSKPPEPRVMDGCQ